MSGLLFFGAIGLWFFIAIGLGLWLTKLFKEKWRVLAGFVLVPLVVFAPFADEIVGAIYMHKICDADGGYRFSQPVESVSRAAAKVMPITQTWYFYPVHRYETTYVNLDTNQEFGRLIDYRNGGGVVLSSISDGLSRNCPYVPTNKNLLSIEAYKNLNRSLEK
jgi:hypothetical protein